MSERERQQAAAAPPAPEVLLLLIRHAEQRTMRAPDAELSARGERQAERLAERLAQLPLTGIVSSHLRRAVQTAAAISRRTGIAPEVDEELEEVRISPEARRHRYTVSPAAILEPNPDDYTTAALAMVRLAPRTRWRGGGGVEGIEELRRRGLRAVERVIARHHAGVVACVSHGGTINAVLGAWAGVERDMWFVPWHTGVSAVLVNGEHRALLTINDASHLAPDQDMLHIVAGDIRGTGR
ncbi:MAG TPA: histidine phosphatase family protein [Candidatus Dormibacteraeota bacterium]|nr:histidine phosphatase family protein [Candidatus Dormibacteraeota bacterium]